MRILLAFLCLVSTSFGQLIWSDEFDTFDPAKWSMFQYERHHAFNTYNTLKVKDGILSICPFTWEKHHYSAILSTEKFFQFSTGYLETRVKLDTKSGAWSDIWLYSRAMEQEKAAEIDLFEHRETDGGNNISDIIQHTVHFNGYGARYTYDLLLSKILPGFNVFGLEWTDTEYKFFLNGEQVWVCKVGLTTEKLFLMMSVEVRDQFWAGAIASDGYDGTSMMDVDYVRVFKTKPLTAR